MGSNSSEGKVVVDWRSEIVAAVAVDQTLMRVDVDRLWSYSLPEVRATEQEIVRTEEHLGFCLPDQYRSFLLYANGWKNFSQDVMLFGTHELLAGEMHDQAQRLLEYSKEDLEPIDYDFDEFLPIAVSMSQIDYFILGKTGGRWEGQVIWIAGYIIEEYPTFLDCFQTLVAYNKIQARDYAEKHRLEGEPRFEIPVFDDDGRGGK